MTDGGRKGKNGRMVKMPWAPVLRMIMSFIMPLLDSTKGGPNAACGRVRCRTIGRHL